MISQVAVQITHGPLKRRAGAVRLHPGLTSARDLITLPPEGLVTVGRALDCWICLPPDDDQISRRHFALEITRDTVRVRDCGSRNGTYVNGRKLARQRIPNGHGPDAGGLAPTMTLEDGDCVLAG